MVCRHPLKRTTEHDWRQLEGDHTFELSAANMNARGAICARLTGLEAFLPVAGGVLRDRARKPVKRLFWGIYISFNHRCLAHHFSEHSGQLLSGPKRSKMAPRA